MNNYITLQWPDNKPSGKYNCIVWLHDGSKITCRYDPRNGVFVGLYGDCLGATFDVDVKEWCYAILKKPLSYQAEDVLFQMARDKRIGDIEAMQTFAEYPQSIQARVFSEMELLNAAIRLHIKGIIKYE